MLKHSIGVDEVGRGPWAGPVLAAAVILNHPLEGLTDSKKLSVKKRLHLAQLIQEQALDFAYGEASVEEIDQLNIHAATLLAMQRAIHGLSLEAQHIVIDGCHAPQGLRLPVTTMISGDLLHPSISAASILAKVKRDALMQDMANLYPEYGFEQHKGYGTKQHMAALETHGPCLIHRQSFKPIQVAMARRKTILLP